MQVLPKNSIEQQPETVQETQVVQEKAQQEEESVQRVDSVEGECEQSLGTEEQVIGSVVGNAQKIEKTPKIVPQSWSKHILFGFGSLTLLALMVYCYKNAGWNVSGLHLGCLK
jgi:hypothetical protein